MISLSGVRMLFFIIFLLIPTYTNSMQESIPVKPSKISKILKAKRIPLAIAITPGGKLVVLDKERCTFFDYNNEETVQQCPVTLSGSQILVNKIYVHPKKDIVIIPDDHGYRCTLFEGIHKKTKLRYGLKNESSNIIFDDYKDEVCALKDGFYAFKGKSLIYHADQTTKELKLHLSPIFIFNVNINQSIFFFCDEKKKTMYRLLAYGVEEKLFNFCTKLDFAHWVYDVKRERLYAVTHKDRKLYIGCTKTGKQQVLTIPDFKISTLELLTNKRILALLSQHRDRICYIDLNGMRPLLITVHEISEPDTRFAAKGQKIAVSPDGEDIIVGLSDQCLVIKIPPRIGGIDACEKYSLLRMINFPKELHDFIGFLLFMLNKQQ